MTLLTILKTKKN